MENVNKQGPLLEVAKTKAKEIVKAFSNRDKFQIITNDFEGRHQRFNSKEDVLNIIDEIKISSSVRFFSEVFKRQSEFLKSSNLINKNIFAISDAQKATFNLNEINNDTTVKVVLVPLKANETNNLYIDSCWFESPLQQKGFIQKLHAKIINNGNANVEIGSAKLYLNKQQIAISSFSVEANSTTEIKFTFDCKQEGINYGSIKIEDYPITFDDELFFAFNSKVNISVCVINGKDQNSENSITNLLKSDSLFKSTIFSEQAIDFSVFKTSDVIFLNQLTDLSSGLVTELLKVSEVGGSIVFIPSQNLSLINFNQSLSAFNLPNLTTSDSSSLKVDKIESTSAFYSGVFEKINDRMNLPTITKHFKLQTYSKMDFEGILTLQNSDVFFGESKKNNATVYLITSPLNEKCTNFSKHALFVPTMYQICFNSVKALPLFYNVSSNVLITIKNDITLKDQPVHIKQVSGDFDIIPESRLINNALALFPHNQINIPGFFEVLRNNSLLIPLAFNYSRKESDLNCLDNEQLTKIINDETFTNINIIENTANELTSFIQQGTEGKRLWKLFIILTLLFIAAEVAILRILK